MTYTLLSEIKAKNNLANMTIAPAASDGQLALLESGQVDIATDIEPNISIAEDKGDPVVFDLSAWSDPQAITGVTTTDEIIKYYPQVVQKVVDGLQEAITMMYKDPEISYRVARKIYPNLSDKVVHAAVDRMLKDDIYSHSVVVNNNLWQRTLKTHLDNGELKKAQLTTVAVDNSFSFKAAQQFAPDAK
jgi:NitT/TauT family transport system substrate-binding protein